MSQEWKEKLKKYYAGNLSDEEVKEVEMEIEKLEVYQELLEEELDDETVRSDNTVKKKAKVSTDLPPKSIDKILKSGIRNARLSLVAYVIMILLLIYPIMTIVSYIYYGWGGKAEDLIDVAIQTVYVTEPNVSLEEMEIEEKVGLFTFDVYMDLYKRVGKSDIKQGDWIVNYQFDQATTPKRNYISESPPNDIPYYDTMKLFHPEARMTNIDGTAWTTLNKLPEGTVAEVYISLEELYAPEKIKEITENLNIEWRWYAIDTGLEAEGKSSDGGYLAPIGYPAQPDPDAWSPYNTFGENEGQFMDSLRFLEQYEQQAVDIAHGKWLDLSERIRYLENNGIRAYGGVLTGPTKEILKLRENKAIRTIHIGEVRLWNW
ncbi:anti-sigma factor [Oceanobacillus bengalensis]|uniref:Anti-sigma factor n=1 Tax=Oceanobacillus bengalensis TaxID=1435466 RepID=A0A494Z522_9BACI|nr:anti-sigma factor [Oceanobacillus bengalensis]RKQ17640.1 anti-sigma factor [Oceanobacillus bengalensis]